MIYTSVFSIRGVILLPSILQNTVFRGQAIKLVEQLGDLGKESFLSFYYYYYFFVNQTVMMKVTAGFLVYFFLGTCELILVNN